MKSTLVVVWRLFLIVIVIAQIAFVLYINDTHFAYWSAFVWPAIGTTASINVGLLYFLVLKPFTAFSVAVRAALTAFVFADVGAVLGPAIDADLVPSAVTIGFIGGIVGLTTWRGVLMIIGGLVGVNLAGPLGLLAGGSLGWWMGTQIRRTGASMGTTGRELSIAWLQPWHAVDGSERQLLQNELQKELREGHPLFRKQVQVVGRRQDEDDVLCRIEGSKSVAVVHLTWRSSPESDPSWPSTRFYDDIDAWIETCMKPDHG